MRLFSISLDLPPGGVTYALACVRDRMRISVVGFVP